MKSSRIFKCGVFITMFKVERTAFRRKLFLTFTLLTFGVAFYFTLSSAQADPVWMKVGVPTYAATEDALVLSGSYAAPQVFNASGTELTLGTDFKYGSSGEDVGKLSDLNYLTKMCLSGEMSGSVKNNLLNDGSKVVLTFDPDVTDWRSRLPIVKYSVTTANDSDVRDPDDWILYGTNDGTEWTQIASVTDAALPGGNVKETDRYIQYDFPVVDTGTAFSQYKFEFTGNRGANTIFQMGDLVLWSENPESTPDFTSKPELNRNYVPLMVTGCEVWKDGESLAENKSSTWFFGTNEGFDQLLDQEIVTASDAKTKMCLVASSGNFFDRFDAVTLDFQNAFQKNTTTGGVLDIPETIQKKELTAYSITTGNDQPNRTPDDWVLYGSNDNKNWTVIDTIESAGLSKTSTMYTIPLEESVPANRFYRLEITDSIGKIQAMQFAEFTLWDTPTGEEYAKLPAAKNITVTPRGGLHSNDYESVAKLQDGRTDKYLGYFNADKKADAATQLSADKPLSITFEMDDTYLLEAYSFTTANDLSGRDPSDWQVFGSTNGTDWTLLDEIFDFAMTEERYATHQFDLDSEQGYGWFRFDFLGTKGETNGFQLAELTFYGISTNQVPEPASFVLLAFGVLGLFSVRKLRKGTAK